MRFLEYAKLVVDESITCASSWQDCLYYSGECRYNLCDDGTYKMDSISVEKACCDSVTHKTLFHFEKFMGLDNKQFIFEFDFAKHEITFGVVSDEYEADLFVSLIKNLRLPNPVRVERLEHCGNPFVVLTFAFDD